MAWSMETVAGSISPVSRGHHIPQNSSRFEDSQRGSTEQLRPCWPLRNVRLLELLRICGVRLFSPKRLSNAAETGEYARGVERAAPPPSAPRRYSTPSIMLIDGGHCTKDWLFRGKLCGMPPWGLNRLGMLPLE